MSRHGKLPWLLAACVLAVSSRELAFGLVQAAKDLSGHDFSETFFLVQRWSRGAVPLWLPHARLGQPFLALLYTQALYPPRFLFGALFGPIIGTNALHVFHGAWAFAGLYLAAHRLGLRRWLAFVAAAPFSLSPFFTEFAQNLSFASTSAWAGWVLWAALGLRSSAARVGPSLALTANATSHTAVLALTLGAAFHAGAPEMWLWEVMLVVCVVAQRRAAWPWAVAALGWAGALAAVVALPAAELAREYTAPGAPTLGQLEWSLSPTQLLSLAVPDADWPRAGAYWGGADQRFLFSLFIGAGPVLLALLGASSRRARPFIVLVVACLLLALGKHFIVSSWLLQVPPFRLFRYPVKYAVGALFGLSVLAGFGARRLLALRRARPQVAQQVLLGLLGGSVGLFLASWLPGAREGFHDGAWWLVLAALALALVARRPVLLSSLVALELLAVPHERWTRLDARALAASSPLGARLRAEQAGRVSLRVDMDDRALEASGPWDVEGSADQLLLDGRKRLSSLRFVEEDLRATGGYGFRDPWRLTRAFSSGGPNAFALANVTHFVRNTDAAPPLPGLAPRLEPGLDDVWTWTWAQARPRGWVATRATVVTDDEAFARLGAPLDENEVLIDHGPALSGQCRSEPVETTEVEPEHVVQAVTACGEGYVVLADAWFPGWQVSVDGQSASAVRAFGFLRAVHVAAGAHTVDWQYRPVSFRLGGAVSLLALLVAAVVLLPRKSRQGADVK